MFIIPSICSGMISYCVCMHQPDMHTCIEALHGGIMHGKEVPLLKFQYMILMGWSWTIAISN